MELVVRMFADMLSRLTHYISVMDKETEDKSHKIAIAYTSFAIMLHAKIQIKQQRPEFSYVQKCCFQRPIIMSMCEWR